MPEDTPHINHPNAFPTGLAILYMTSVSITNKGKEPMPPGVMIIDSVASVSTEQAALIPK